MSSRSDAHLLAVHLARAINPHMPPEGMPVAVAMLQPVARATVEALASNGYRITSSAPEPSSPPTLRLLPGDGECHNGTCDCDPDDTPA